MTLSTAVLWSLVRAIVAATLALAPSRALVARIQTTESRLAGRLWLIAAIGPLLIPELLVGYTWRLAAAGLVHSALATELLYGGLLLIRAVSVMTAVRLMLPASAIDRSALFSWALLRPCVSGWNWWSVYLKMLLFGPWKPLLIGWSLTALLCFQEFETAALLQIDRYPVAWTVWLFDAHAAHQPLSDSVRMLIVPVVTELLLLTPVWLLLQNSSRTSDSTPETAEPIAPQPNHSARWSSLLLLLWIPLAAGVGIFWPILSNLLPALNGMGTLFRQSALITQSGKQIAVSMGFAGAAAVVSLQMAAWLRHLHRPLLTIGLLLPGLGGALLTGLCLLAAFQIPPLQSLYDTWLPMLLGLAVTQLPRAWLFVGLIHRQRDTTAVYSTRLLLESPHAQIRRRSNTIRWHLQATHWFLAGLVIGNWCFWDVTIASLLRPIQLEPVVTRLYNEMHYGRTQALTLIALMAAFAFPAVALLAAAFWKAWSSPR